jgi:uncharacterized membrane protein HdeD (DUF308 family)
MNSCWFKPKQYGYGATPTTWQGWAVTGAAVIAIVAAALLILAHNATSLWAWVAFFAIEAMVVAALWIVGRGKTDGEWRWRWGQN